MDKQTILQKIIAVKKKQLERRKQNVPEEFLKEQITRLTSPRPFAETINAKILANDIAVIAEIKKASPSKGKFAVEFSPEELAKIYEENNATCISVLTETNFFLGSDNDLKTVKLNTSLPVLRKDFIIDAYQIYESAFIGADCILLIAAILSDKELKEFYKIAQLLHLDVLVEVHTHEELEKVLPINPRLIGINNRDLRTFTVDLKKTLELAKEIPAEKIIVCESGIDSRADIEAMVKNNIRAFLIGETLLKAQNPGQKLNQLLGNA